MTVETILLGAAQDAGVPQAGCYCYTCKQARVEPDRRQFATSLGITDRTTGQSWIIDATPDFKDQLHILHQFAPECALAGIILTHVHMGHYTGLIHLGPEAMNSARLPVYITEKVNVYLRENQPWADLIQQKNISPKIISPGTKLPLTPNLAIQPVKIPHRDEYSDTMAFIVQGPTRRHFFCPDIDSWDDWDHEVRSFVADMDIALLDASFFSPDELPGRDMSKIRHPLVTDTIERLRGVECDVCLIHLNHSNPLLANGPERARVEATGFTVGATGKFWNL